jgi:hypothetical protein
MLGGGLGILGGGLGIASALFPALGATLGPIGLGVGLLGAVLPSILGGGGPVIPPMPSLNYQQGTFDGRVGSGQYAGAASQMGTNINAILKATGGTINPAMLWGGTFASGTTHTWNGQQWQGQDYTQANLMSPGGGFAGWIGAGTGQGTTPQDAAEHLAYQIIRSDILTGAVSGISKTITQIFSNIGEGVTQTAADIVSFANAYDKVGKAANPAKDAIDKIAASFQDLRDKAVGYGVSTAPIDNEIAKQTKRTAQDWIDSMLDPLAVQMRALQDEQDAALESAKYINENVADVYADTAKIAEYYTNKKADLEAQYFQQSTSQLQALVDRLTYGDLANASPATALAGTSAAYSAQLALAQSGNTSAIQGLSGYAEQYATALRGNYASSPTYTAGIALLRQQLEGVIGVTSGGAAIAGAPLPLDQSSGALVQSNAELRAIVTQQSDQIAALSDMVTQLTAQLRTGSIARF